MNEILRRLDELQRELEAERRQLRAITLDAGSARTQGID